jgi:hypothetical protein
VWLTNGCDSAAAQTGQIAQRMKCPAVCSCGGKIDGFTSRAKGKRPGLIIQNIAARRLSSMSPLADFLKYRRSTTFAIVVERRHW